MQENARMFTSGLVGIIITLVVVGLLLYLVELIPMDGAIKQIIRIIVVIAVVIWLLNQFGLMGYVTNLFHSGPPPHPVPVHPAH
jgi:hypothetical protein